MSPCDDAPVAASASRFFSLPPEVWKLVGEQIHGPKTLKALTLVCRAFCTIFSPLLHAHFTINLSDRWLTYLKTKPLPAQLLYTKHFEVLIDVLREESPDENSHQSHGSYDPLDTEDYARYIAKLLDSMPNLQSFRWADHTYSYAYKTTEILRYSGLVDALKKARKLKHLSLLFSSNDLSPFGPTTCFMPLGGFQNLVSLELYDFYDHSTNFLAGQIASLLSRCQGLKSVGLGLALEDIDFEVYILEPEKANFMEKLCLAYKAHGCPPLILETLKLGHGLLMKVPELDDKENYLEKMVRVDRLKTLHLWNGMLSSSAGLQAAADSGEPVKCHWPILANCVSLRQFSISQLDQEVIGWLNTCPWIEELLIAGANFIDLDDDRPFLYLFPELKLPNLQTIYTNFDRRISYQRGSWAPTILYYLDKSSIGIGHLRGLTICQDIRYQWKEFSAYLPSLTHLKQLSLSANAGSYYDYLPQEIYRLWPEITSTKELTYRFAELISSITPALEYIKIKCWAWQVTKRTSPSSDDRPSLQLPVPENMKREAVAILTGNAPGPLRVQNLFDHVELRELEFEELKRGEMGGLGWCTWGTQSGLLTPVRYRD